MRGSKAKAIRRILKSKVPFARTGKNEYTPIVASNQGTWTTTNEFQSAYKLMKFSIRNNTLHLHNIKEILATPLEALIHLDLSYKA